MQTRAMGPGAGWSWLVRAVNLGRNNPRALFGAAALLMVIALVPSLVQLFAQFALGVTDMDSMLWIAAFTTLVLLVVYPLLIGGFFRIIDATEHGRPTRATALFDTFKSGPERSRLIGFGLVLTAVYVAAFALIFGLLGGEVTAWYREVLEAAKTVEAGGTPVVPPAPGGTGMVFALSLLAMMFLGGVYSIGVGQASLGGRDTSGALADGFGGALKNLLPLLLLTIVALVLMVVIALVLALVFALVGAIGALIHPAVAVMLVTPLYLAFLVAMYVVLFGIMYFIWRDVAGTAPPMGDHQVEL